MLVYQKTMFDRYYCIKSFCHLKTLVKHFERFIFLLLYWRTKAWRIRRFWKWLFQSKDLCHPNVTNLVHFYACYCWWRQFLWRPRMCTCKVQKLCINSTWIAWLIHGFLPVKTWLLIACDSAFYAIITGNRWTDSQSDYSADLRVVQCTHQLNPKD